VQRVHGEDPQQQSAVGGEESDAAGDGEAQGADDEVDAPKTVATRRFGDEFMTDLLFGSRPVS
jgi:hypothetical protein